MTEMDDIRQGVWRFRKIIFHNRRILFEKLAKHQEPQVLFISCIDSRINPALLCHADPGDMFVERTPGNLVPIYNDQARVGVSASIEYAVAALQVTDIIICGHSDCGALKALLHPEKLAKLPAVERWLHFADEAIDHVNLHHAHADEETRLHHLCEQNVRAQMEHLHSHPSVQNRLKTGKLHIHGWVYHIHTGEVFAYNEKSGAFELWPPD